MSFTSAASIYTLTAGYLRSDSSLCVVFPKETDDDDVQTAVTVKLLHIKDFCSSCLFTSFQSFGGGDKSFVLAFELNRWLFDLAVFCAHQLCSCLNQESRHLHTNDRETGSCINCFNITAASRVKFPVWSTQTFTLLSRLQPGHWQKKQITLAHLCTVENLWSSVFNTRVNWMLTGPIRASISWLQPMASTRSCVPLTTSPSCTTSLGRRRHAKGPTRSLLMSNRGTELRTAPARLANGSTCRTKSEQQLLY